MPRIQLRYFAISAFEVVMEEGMRVLIDPCITGYEGHGISPVPLEEIKDIDLILVSHAAADHVGDTEQLAKMMPRSLILCGPEVRYHLVKRGIDPSRFRYALHGVSLTFGEVKIKCVRSEHISFMNSDGEMISGTPLGFILSTESGIGIYHPGDTGIFGDMKLYGELYKPQIAMLPVGGMGPPDFASDMSPEEAALICRWMGLKWAIPVHYIEGASAPEDFALAVRKLAPATTAVIMKPGEWKTFEI
ncbi:MAG: MBL fold metallo-hydrolase [Chloroflexi bacterium]|nr:MBL fold metallo-hydrolase [Chloroflexota bacterium]